MEKYLKISDYFGGDLSVSSGTRERIVSAKGEVLATTPSPKVAKLAVHAINSHDELVAMNKELMAALEKVVSDITALSENSYGVHGLHRNGDLAPWNSLFSGGFFEGWLLSVDEAGDVIAKAKAKS